jgi:predicted RNA-binding Zn-ribbon protein involved in translation (DUF1610 family)
MTSTSNHAIIPRDGFDVPLIGIPAEAALQECDCCGDIVPLRKARWTGAQFLCPKCDHVPREEVRKL